MIFLLLAFILSFMPPPPITLTMPSGYQVFQRETSTTGTLHIRGRFRFGGYYALSAQWGDFNSGMLYAGINADFDVQWHDLPIGQHDLIVTINDTSFTVEHVGIGDVYLVAGQSNAVSAGIHLQVYMNNFGLRAGMFNTTGWHEMADPVGAEPYDAMQAGGSQWPLLASYIMRHNIPVAIGVTAVSGSSIATWQPDKLRYTYITDVLDALPIPRVRAILWQQGESDGMHGMSAKDYSILLTKLATSLHDAYGVPFLPARLYDEWYSEINKGIDMAVEGNDFILPGANLFFLKPNNIHYIADDKLQAEGWEWYAALVCDGFYVNDSIECNNY